MRWRRPQKGRDARDPQNERPSVAAFSQVEGVTVQDEMEESQKVRDAHNKAEAERAAKEKLEAVKQKQKKAAERECEVACLKRIGRKLKRERLS